jgi:dTDP-4-amino-4,6-dideoxygalactose transaminase
MNPPIPQVDLFLDHAELALIEQSVERRWLTEGPYAKAFQDAIRAHTGSKHGMFAP